MAAMSAREEERDQLEKTLFPKGKFDIVADRQDRPRSSRRRPGIRVPPRTRVLVVPLDRIGDDYPLSREKLCPVLGFYRGGDARCGDDRLPGDDAAPGRRPFGRDPCRAIPTSSCALAPR